MCPTTRLTYLSEPVLRLVQYSLRLGQILLRDTESLSLRRHALRHEVILVHGSYPLTDGFTRLRYLQVQNS